MAKNFSQKDILEDNNSREEARAGGAGKIFLYVVMSVPLGAGWIYYVKKQNWYRNTKEKMLEQLSNIDAKLTERYNVLTNQMKIAKEALKHEKDVLSSVTKARAGIVDGNQPFSPDGVASRSAAVAGMATRFNMVQEQYPQLKTMPVMQQLNDTVKDLEADLEAQRRFYTRVARDFNSAMKTYPTNVVGDNMNLKRFPMFEAEDEQRKNVTW